MSIGLAELHCGFHIILNSCIEIELTHHTIHPPKMSDSVAFGIFTELCGDHSNLEHFC